MEINDDVYKDLLGIVLTDSSRIPYITTKVPLDTFPKGVYKEIYNAVIELYNIGVDVDIVTVSNRLLNTGKLKDIGGRQVINELALNASASRLTNQIIEAVLSQNTFKKVSTMVDDFKSELEKSPDVNKVCMDYCSKISNIVSGNADSDKIETISSSIDDVLEDMRMSKEHGTIGLSTGFSSLDYYTGGLQKGKLYIVGARPSMGKGQSLDCKILTPSGWIKNRDIKLGDKVIGRDGKPTTVIGIYPQPLQKCYKITFKDGRENICDAPHEWTVKCKDKGVITLTAEELYNKLQHKRYQNRISLVNFTGDYGTEKDFIIPPYIMGVLIGDGCLTRALCYCKPSKKVFDNVKSFMPDGTEIKYQLDGKTVQLNKWYKALAYIREVGLNTQSYNKFIPQEYFHSSKQQRELLFQGLIDTDGYNRGDGSWEYSTTSKQLAKDIQQLAWSLGYNCRMGERMGRYRKNNKIIETRINYRLYITSCKPLTIIKVEEVEPIPTQCIHVDNDEHLFVCEDYLVTHNSSFVMNVAEYVSQSHNVLFISLEMSRKEYAQRMLFSRANVDVNKINSGTITDEDIKLVSQQKDYLDNLNLFIETKTPCRVSDIELAIINLQATKGSCDLVAVDYLQLLTPMGKNSKNREVEVAEMSRDLKSLAIKYQVPIIVLSQLSRGLESRENKRPMLSDLRESGAIEQDADVVTFLYRNEYYYPDDPASKGAAELLIRKNRGGQNNRDIEMCWQPSRVKFMEVSRREI